jgi:coproporphyrinogen III oxidase
MNRKEIVQEWFKFLQQQIINELEEEDGQGKFGVENWDRPGGGGGITRLLQRGSVFEKGGVNFSAVFGPTPLPIQKAFELEAGHFFASGVSIVIHPTNPFVPIIHMNVRYFELDNGRAWFGGGIDLTPAYVFEEDGHFFHSSLKTVCESFQPGSYKTFKERADSYFRIRHRDEARGIGGIFYDRLDASSDADFNKLWLLTQKVGNAFAPTYRQIVGKRKDMEFNADNKFWQLHRRSRYVEFNLVYDAGTKFGLETNGRTESILMSLPPVACWESNFIPVPGSWEARSQDCFTNPKVWA